MQRAQTTDRAEVVIIGGGILGCCAAYHLHQAGAGRVMLLEQAPELGVGTTSAGAGFVSLWGAEFAQWGEREVQLERYAQQFYRELGAEHDIGFKAVGMARLAVTAAGAGMLADQYAQARRLVSADEVTLLAPKHVSDLTPAVDPVHVHAALYWPTAIRVDAARAARPGAPLECCGRTDTHRDDRHRHRSRRWAGAGRAHIRGAHRD